MQCEMLIILGKDGINDLKDEDTKLVFDGHAESTKNFKSYTIDGDHFVHLTNPERVAQLIKEYVMTSDLTKKVDSLAL